MKSAFTLLSALVLAATYAGPARAAEMMGGDLTIRPTATIMAGFYGTGVGDHKELVSGSPVNREYQEILIKSDAEIGIVGSLVTDSGIRVGSEVTWNLDQELENYTMTFSNPTGTLQLGGVETAPVQLHVSFKPFTPGGQEGSIDGGAFYFLPRLSTAPSGNDLAGRSTYIEIGDDTNMITYITPRFAGLKLGVSYVPSARDKGQENQATPILTSQVASDETGIEDIIAVAANYYVGRFHLSAGYLIGNTAGDADDAEVLSLGARAKFGRLTLGGGYSSSEGLQGSVVRGFDTTDADVALADANGITGTDSDFEFQTIAFGLTYETGPWTIGAAWRSSEKSYMWAKATEAADDGGALDAAVEEEDTNDAFQFGVSYTMGGGLDLGLDVRLIEDTSDRIADTLTPDVDVFVGGILLGYKF